MKKVIFCFSLIFCLLLTSCVSLFSIPKEKSYTVLPEESTVYTICIDSIDVKKDTITDSDLIDQVYNISQTLLSDLIDKVDNYNVLNLQIELKQRSYFKGIRQQNSIFFVYSLFDEDGNILFNSSYSLVCSDTIESSTLEYKLLNHMNKKIRSFLKKSGKIKTK